MHSYGRSHVPGFPLTEQGLLPGSCCLPRHDAACTTHKSPHSPRLTWPVSSSHSSTPMLYTSLCLLSSCPWISSGAAWLSAPNRGWHGCHPRLPPAATPPAQSLPAAAGPPGAAPPEVLLAAVGSAAAVAASALLGVMGGSPLAAFMASMTRLSPKSDTCSSSSEHACVWRLSQYRLERMPVGPDPRRTQITGCPHLSSTSHGALPARLSAGHTITPWQQTPSSPRQ